MLSATESPPLPVVNTLRERHGKDTDLRVDKPVYAIHLANVREF